MVLNAASREALRHQDPAEELAAGLSAVANDVRRRGQGSSDANAGIAFTAATRTPTGQIAGFQNTTSTSSEPGVHQPDRKATRCAAAVLALFWQVSP